jgi:heat shock protein HtpX
MSTSFRASAVDWREQLRKNSIRTRWVIGIFLLIYVAIGVLLDVYLYSMGWVQLVAQGGVITPPTPSQALMDIVTFQVVPWATLVMLAVAVISIIVTFKMYDRLMLLGTEYVEATPESDSLELKQLYNVVEEMKVAAGLRYIPKVYLIKADYMNAFASGYSEKSAMIAITEGLLKKLNRAELQAVMAHELSHIRHGDIKVTLAASVLSNLMLMAIDILFYNVIFGGGNRRGVARDSNVLLIVIMVVRFALPLVTVLLMLYISRKREYMADAGAVELLRDNEPLVNALLKIHHDHEGHAEAYAAAYNATPHDSVRREAYIYDPVKMGIEAATSPSDWFSTHPGLKKRLAALGYKGVID